VFDALLVAGGIISDIFNDRAHRAATLAVVALDQVGDFRTQADLDADEAAGGELYRVGGVTILRIGNEQVDAFGVFAHRTDRVLLQETQRQRQAIRRRVRAVARGQQRQSEHFARGFGHVAFGDQAQSHQQGGQRATRLRLQALRPRQVGVLQPPAAEQRRRDQLFRRVGLDRRVHLSLSGMRIATTLAACPQTQARAFSNMRCQGEASPHSGGCQLICTVRCTRSGCGISSVLRPSRLLRPAMPSGEPFGLAG
jgi:hypothetical protein